MKNNQINLYSFNKQNLIVLLSVYNTVFLLSTAVLNNRPVICFAIASLFLLITLLAIVWIDIMQKKNENEFMHEHEQGLILKKLRDEYLKVHKMNKGNELLKRTSDLSKEQSSAFQGEHFVSRNKSFQKIKGVHFDYINNGIPRENSEGQPEGS